MERPPDSLDLEQPQSCSGAILCGYLRRSGRTGKSLGLRQKRYYKLDGAIFSKHLSEKTSATIWDLNVQGAQVARLGRTHFGIKLLNLEKRASRDFHNDLLVLYARTEEECFAWFTALSHASQRKLEDYYQVLQLIGEGGFAKVRLGRCLTSNLFRAIKTMSKVEGHAKVLGTEVAIIKRVNHPNIVKTFDVFETTQEIHIVMEYMEGGMLYDSIEDGVQFSEADVVQFMRELLDGVMYLHDMGIVHRDIKPENVLCTSRKTPLHVKIADFGLSSISSVADMKANRMLMSTMIGTPEFVAPEIARHQTYTEKVDMWALGMLCYNVIARRLPLDESRDMIAQIQEGISLTFPEKEWLAFSPEAQSFIRSLLCVQAEKRLSPLGCLVHPWVENHKPEQSTKFAAHGRMSVALYAPSAQYMVPMRLPAVFNFRNAWKKAFIAVSALCIVARSCDSMKIFGNARLRAMTMRVKSPFDEIDTLSNESLLFSARPRLDSADNTSMSTTSVGGASRRGSEVDTEWRRMAGAQDSSSSARITNGQVKLTRIASELCNDKSRDTDLAFDDLDMTDGLDKDFDIPNSMSAIPFTRKWHREDGVSSRAMARIPILGMKMRAALGNDASKRMDNGRRNGRKGTAEDARGKTETVNRSGSDGMEAAQSQAQASSPYWNDGMPDEARSMGPGVVPTLLASYRMQQQEVRALPDRKPSQETRALPDRKPSLRKKLLQTFDKKGTASTDRKNGRNARPMSKWSRKLMKKSEGNGNVEILDPLEYAEKEAGPEDDFTAELDDAVSLQDETQFLQSSSEERTTSTLKKYLRSHKAADAGSSDRYGAQGSIKEGKKKDLDLNRLKASAMSGREHMLDPGGRSRGLEHHLSPMTPAAESVRKMPFRK